jgi:hypothetical protein
MLIKDGLVTVLLKLQFLAKRLGETARLLAAIGPYKHPSTR